MSDFKAKMHQNRFRLGLRPNNLAGGAYSAPPDPLAVFKGPTSKGKGEGEEMREREREGEGEEMREREGEGKGGEGETTLHTPCRKFLATPLLQRLFSTPHRVIQVIPLRVSTVHVKS